jgi:predicted nucleotidyltransferase
VASEREESRLFAQLRELATALGKAEIPFALIGGFAVNAYGFMRATHDLDVMVGEEQGDALQGVLMKLGYQTLDRRSDIASYVRAPLRLDVLYARRDISRGLLARSTRITHGDTQVHVIPLEGLIGLKVQAFHDDPRRIRDLDDIIQLLKINRGNLNLDEVRSYFRLFDSESVLDDILRALD